MQDYSYIFNAHPTFIENMYKKYMENPAEIEDGWRTFFQGFEFATNGESKTNTNQNAVSEKEFGVMSLIHGFRDRGHLLSKTNPIRERRDRKPHLDLADYNLTEADLSQSFAAAGEIGIPGASLAEVIDQLHKLYCGPIGFEFGHIEDRERRMWLRNKIEGRQLKGGWDLSLNEKQRILKKLNGAVVFEKFLHTKYIGQKRFSLEGGETAIAAIDAAIDNAAQLGVKEVLIGMAHRGRLNVLANIMGKTYEQIFNEFEGTAVPNLSFGDGDVKYHLGFSSQVETPSGNKVDLKLVPNPSHLESVGPVLEGISRAKADLLYNSEYDKILPFLIHGDAAIAGQGIAYETVQMSQLEGYHTGGTIHFVINNQIGFTTDFDDARSSTYCTASAYLVQAPVFHVNGDDPEAVVYAIKLAIEYRQKFNTDVFVDMVCYRKHGHNEGDDPKFTQPEMYGIISKHKNPREIYSEILINRGDVQKQLAEQLESEFWSELQERLDFVKQKKLPYDYQKPELEWKSLTKTTKAKDFEVSPVTGIPKDVFNKLIEHIMTYPSSLTPLPKIDRLLKGKRKLLDKGKFDWAMAELIAYGSILLDGKNVRMSGQDVKRGTFSHRHAIINDHKTFEEYNRLDNIDEKQGKFMIYNSLLSEFGVLGFEYGYSMSSPNSLVIWEAQFGDFYNGAQTIVDQFISAAESKWRRMSGLVMLLPHGYEGQGPEHSSARLERFLQLCAENNMTVANVSTPANYFHLIRRQLKRPFRKPLIVMSPKSLLRHPLCVSEYVDFSPRKRFQEIFEEPENEQLESVKTNKLILCSGKIYFEIKASLEADQKKDFAIIRVEQLYPFPEKKLRALFEKYSYNRLIWVQEEPANMGAGSFVLSRLNDIEIEMISRSASASTATGFKKIHDEQQKSIIDQITR